VSAVAARKKRTTGRVVPKKVRRTWAINPRTRVHSQEGYRRSRAKTAERRRIVEEWEQGER